MEKLFVWYAIVLSYVAGIAQASNLYRNSLVVDLGYEIYEGYYNATSDLNVFKGLRYAAPPTGSLRWQKPRSPAVNRTITLNATAYPPRCPQSPDSPLATNFDFDESGLGDEDCLFATIFAPANASDLPVMVWIRT
ncbi:Carboxylesterase [Coniella lustricola]|uniref:Carboxylesterase n=1 Tax=Coniella lustricola TaxID=2025994 RepID=A0A2T3A7Z9_9PEZI|nr:Carboxylesterase [Coniella lustricola]